MQHQTLHTGSGQMTTHVYLKHFRRLWKHYRDALLYNLLYVKQDFKSEQNLCDERIPPSTMVYGVIAGVVTLMILHELYYKVVVGILRRIGVAGRTRSHVSGAIWNFGFYSSCAMCNLWALKDFNDSLFSTSMMPFPLLVCSVIFVSFCIHSALLAAKKGCSGQLVTKLLVAAILCSSYTLRFVWLGIYCMMIVSLAASSAELARIFAGLKRNKWANTSSLQSIINCLFVMHCLVWSVCYLYLFPSNIAWPAFTLQVVDKEIPSILLLNIVVWFYLLSEVLTSNVLKMVQYYLRADCRYIHTEMLDYALFPQHNEVLKYLIQIRRQIQKQQEMDQHYGSMLRNDLSSDLKRTRDSVALMQTVRCVMTLKRRLRRRQQQQQQQQEQEQQEQATESS